MWKHIGEGNASIAKVQSLEREIARLEAEISRLRAEWQYERERADRATDGLLATKGLPPVMPDVVSRATDVGDDPYAKEDPKEVEKMLKAMGLGRTHAEA